MVRIIIRFCLLIAAFYIVSPAATVPGVAWKKTLPSDCYFVANTGDSIICVGTSIFVLSQDGTLLSQSQLLDDTKSISNNAPTFFFTKDHSFIIIKDKCIIKKISLGGEILWSKAFCDSIIGAIFTGYTEDANGKAYLYGTVGYNAGLIVKIGYNGTFISKADTSLRAFSSMVCLRDSLFVVSRQMESLNSKGSLVAFDDKGIFAKRIIDTGCGSPMLIDKEHIFSLNMQDGVPLLFKRTFSSTADIVLKRHSMSGNLDTVIIFDFGKYESPLSMQKYHDGILMITQSNETMSFGTNYVNYFITKLDASLKKQWQLRFGTDTLGLGGNTNHSRYFAVDERGTILATHNDTLFKFIDASTAIQPSTLQREKSSAFSGKTKVFDLQGRFLFDYPVGMGLDAHHVKRQGATPGLKVLHPMSGSASETKVFF